MGRFLTRITIFIVALYFVVAYIVAQLFCIDILYNWYVLLFELCVILYMFSEGKYHCRFMKWTALSIFICEFISHTDYYIDYIAVEWYNLINLSILAIGVCTSLVLAVKHFVRVQKLKRMNR